MTTHSEQVAKAQKAAKDSDSLEQRWLRRWMALVAQPVGPRWTSTQMSLVPSTQYAFAPGRKFKADFAFADKKVLVEINGGMFMRKGGHSNVAGLNRDAEKHRIAASLGWRVLVYTSDDINAGRGFAELLTALQCQPLASQRQVR